MKEENKRRIWKAAKILLFLLIIFTSYSTGRVRGVVDGVYAMNIRNNETFCDLINYERDIDGFCLLSNETYKYSYYLDCGWEKFKLNGEEKMPLIVNAATSIRRIIYYPVLGC